ncbi:iron ABC transporter permease [Aestuariirhabdus sp. Z084]|uniref:FecCD family ABC transporter permease n=1 Tax=Aestuariirhabdus haliotis TaxID=2918751 RepID=UPI00201B384D|nr:iron ABC transporter permease [Aestuariirhabdus haliotis]MCL6417475.1 iron ABC transporter permease [Aestuariirhabdus haliotis]MCL6421406.1 iron ABC transporter permease [Aestuariirhabdus haliotis]
MAVSGNNKRLSVEALQLPLVLMLLLLVVCSVISGPLKLPIVQSLISIWDGIWGSELSSLQPYEKVVIWDLRLPRTLLALLVGALLAQCGVVMQGVFRNPLADPGIIGVASGAALGAALAIVLLPISVQWLTVPLMSFGGGLLTTWVVYGLSKNEAGTSVVVLLLAGVAIAAFCGALIGLLTYVANDQALRDLSLWQMGSLASASNWDLLLCVITLVTVMFFFHRKSEALNALLLGEAEARHLGIEVERLKQQCICVTAIGVGVAVSVSGVIGFVGLVVPHLVRMLVGPDHRAVLPLSALFGGGLLLLADLGARSWMSPAEVPVGLVTAGLGAPFFMLLLYQRRQQLH